MSYVEDNLMPNEKVLFSAKISQAIFLRPLIALLFGIFFFIIALQQMISGEQIQQIFGSFICFFSITWFLAMIFLLIHSIVIKNSTEFAITSRKVILGFKY